MNREVFFNAIRPAFGSLNVKQIEGMGALLDAGRSLPLHHMANVLAQVRRETGGYMYPIKETVMPSHKDKNPSDAEVMRRLERAYAAGKLKKPYWRDGSFGRGQIQLTHRANYAKFGISNFDDAMKLPISAHIAVHGMAEGIFTGRKLADYNFPADLDAPPKLNPRRIVNGQDGSDREVAGFHRQFSEALEKAGWGVAPQRPPEAKSRPPVTAPLAAYVASFLAAAAALWQWGAEVVDWLTFWN